MASQEPSRAGCGESTDFYSQQVEVCDRVLLACNGDDRPWSDESLVRIHRDTPGMHSGAGSAIRTALILKSLSILVLSLARQDDMACRPSLPQA